MRPQMSVVSTTDALSLIEINGVRFELNRGEVIPIWFGVELESLLVLKLYTTPCDQFIVRTRDPTSILTVDY